jgi:phosphoribosylformylglycinamidine synthase
VIFRYTTRLGELRDEANANGSVSAIAGICNDSRNVVGLMPHPERVCEPMLGGVDGRIIFESVIEWAKAGSRLPTLALEDTPV